MLALTGNFFLKKCTKIIVGYKNAALYDMNNSYVYVVSKKLEKFYLGLIHRGRLIQL